MRISGYSIIESDQHDELVEAVTSALGDGWVPCGGVCVWFEPGAATETNLNGAIVHYAQALVRYEP